MKTRLLLIILATFTLTACKVDLKALAGSVGLEKVVSTLLPDTETPSFDCNFSGTTVSGDCEQNYVADITLCPGYHATNNPAPANCTVVPTDTYVSETLFAWAAPGTQFGGWSGGICAGADVCQYRVLSNTVSSTNTNTIYASFEAEPEPQAATYSFDALGRRSTKTVNGVTTYFVYDVHGDIISELQANATLEEATQSDVHLYHDFINIEGQRLAMFDYTNSQTSPALYYYVNDQRGQPIYMLDNTGNMVYELDATPFGEVYGEYKVAGTNIVQPHRLAGQTDDPETGYYQNHFRDTFMPDVGRYLQTDPIGLAGGINTYAYVENNPVMYTDPTGESAVLPAIMLVGRVALVGYAGYQGYEAGRQFEHKRVCDLKKAEQLRIQQEGEDLRPSQTQALSGQGFANNGQSYSEELIKAFVAVGAASIKKPKLWGPLGMAAFAAGAIYGEDTEPCPCEEGN